MSTDRVECSACSSPVDDSTDDTPDHRTPCLVCGSTAWTLYVSLHDTAHARDGIGLKAKRAGEKRPYFESKSIPTHSDSRQKLVHREQTIDRENDRYFEQVTDYESGEVIHLNEELLSKHIGHGTAKPKKPQNAG